jgi:hypothetical protein
MTDFICAYFGQDWTITTRGFNTLKQAEKHGIEMLPIAGIFGFAVIKEEGDLWQLSDDHSILPTNGYNINPQQDSTYQVTF